MDDGSPFSVNRYFLQASVPHAIDPLKSVFTVLGYGLDNYDFPGNGDFAAVDPWENIRAMRLSVPVQWRINRQ